MEILKNNPEGRKKFLELAERGSVVDMENDVYYVVYKEVRMYQLSDKFAARLIEVNAISRI